MLNRKIIYFLAITQILSNESKETPQKNVFPIKLVNSTESVSDQGGEKKYKPVEINGGGLKWKYKAAETRELKPKFLGQTQARFIDQGSNDSVKNNEMEALAGKFSILNILSGDKEDEEEEEEEDDDDGYDEEEMGDSSGDVFSFFDSDKEIDTNELEDKKDEGFLKQYHRQTLRMHNLMFPLLLAYKLKFFTVIPLLLGSLVLLIGTTGIAGFFFALFAAALGIHVKSEPP